MADHPDTPAPDAGDSADLGAELVPSSERSGLAPAESGALLHWLEQSHRDAKANRAQARELTRALEQVRDAHEYVGRALRDEQRKSRRLTIAVILAPILAGLIVWGVWDRLDDLRGDVTAEIREVADAQEELRSAQDELRFGEVAKAQEARADALEAELVRVRADLATFRETAAAAAAERAAEEERLRERIAGLESRGAEATGLRAQLEALRSRSGAESARATELEREIRRLERELGATLAGAGGRTAAAVPPDPGTPPAEPREVPASAAADTGAPAEPAAESVAAAPPAEPDPAAGAVRRPEDLTRIRDELNRLLALAEDPVTYRVDVLGGVRGDTLLDVRVSGVDAQGRAIRTLEAKTATVVVREESDDVLVELRDGHLLLAGRKAPFFDGRYAIVVPGQSAAWRISGLTCVTFR